jgi:hypothetical protein
VTGVVSNHRSPKEAMFERRVFLLALRHDRQHAVRQRPDAIGALRRPQLFRLRIEAARALHDVAATIGQSRSLLPACYAGVIGVKPNSVNVMSPFDR